MPVGRPRLRVGRRMVDQKRFPEGYRRKLWRSRSVGDNGE